MTDEQWLREGLAHAVPPPPTNPDRARAAESLARRRRRTTALAVVGSAGAVAAAAVLTAALAGGGGKDSDDKIATNSPPIVDCPPIKVRQDVAEGSAIDQPDPAAPAAVPEGATSARLCQGPGTVFEVPDDALTTDVADLVTAINGLDETGEPDVCTMDLGPGYRIAFGYDDASSFVVSGQLYGCHTLVVGSGYRADPEAAQAAFLGLLDEQQRDADGEATDDADPADLSCQDTASAADADTVHLTAAILCIDDGSGTQVSAEIDDADLELLVHDMATHQTTAVLRCAAAPPWPTIIGSDDAGTVIAIPSECATSFWRLPNGMAWSPSQEAVAILDRLVSEAG